MRVLFLYTELADYFLKCCEVLAEKAEVHIVSWPVNKEAPFKFATTDRLTIYKKNNYNRLQLIELARRLNPDIVVCSGWIDKDYLHVVKHYFKKTPTVLTCDTHWRGSLKQYAAVILSRFFLLDRFSHAWVPGMAQASYVKKLGFKSASIKQGFYCCDLPKFDAIYKRNKPAKALNFPKRFLYVGRYYNFKGITDLWQAFAELHNEQNNSWELWCLGVGSVNPVEHPKIKHFGFVQPKDLDPILEQTGVFVLPSRYEPWGVVVQEYACAGFPLVLCEAVGASEAFLESNTNGFSFSPSNIKDLKNQLKKVINLDAKKLNEMADKSHELALKINQQAWANSLFEIYNGFKQN